LCNDLLSLDTKDNGDRGVRTAGRLTMVGY